MGLPSRIVGRPDRPNNRYILGARDSASWRLAMSLLAVVLILVATVSHATWNYLTKRSRHRLAFLWWTGVAGTVLYLPAVLLVAPPWSLAARDWPGVAAGAVIRAVYFAALGTAYTRG